MTSETEFQPNWASPPGDTVVDLLAEKGVSLSVFAETIGYDDEALNDLLRGRIEINDGVAQMLEKHLGASASFWLTRERQYRKSLSRLDHHYWLNKLPLKDMIQFGWIKRAADRSAQVEECLRFFGVSDEGAWQRMFGAPLELAAFRTSASFDSEPGAVAAWLRRGELEANAIECKPWNPEQFRRSLAAIRKLTKLKEPRRFVAELTRVCAASGVAVVVLRAPEGCRASGATRFLSSSKALLLLSFRYLSDDHFWFTFFHEAGHLLLHGQDRLFLEGSDTLTNAQEQEANAFAEEILIPSAFRREFERLSGRYEDVIRFATHIGIAPGIVVGQLQYQGRVGRHQLNKAKRRFRWL